MNRCLDCGELFEQPEPGDRELDCTSEAWGTRVAHYVCAEQCPECGSEDITEFCLCDECKKSMIRLSLWLAPSARKYHDLSLRPML